MQIMTPGAAILEKGNESIDIAIAVDLACKAKSPERLQDSRPRKFGQCGSDLHSGIFGKL